MFTFDELMVEWDAACEGMSAFFSYSLPWWLSEHDTRAGKVQYSYMCNEMSNSGWSFDANSGRLDRARALRWVRSIAT